MHIYINVFNGGACKICVFFLLIILFSNSCCKRKVFQINTYVFFVIINRYIHMYIYTYIHEMP